MKSIAVIGSGAYGSYIIDALIKKDPKLKITLFEVGNNKLQDENEIGYKTNMLAKNYLATSKGRFFGFGGSTNKWGGGILLFSKNDFKNPAPFLQDIVKLNEKYKDIIYNKFAFKDDFKEHIINDSFFTKHGIWLGYFRRNLFKYFKIEKRKQVTIIPNARVVHLGKNEKGVIEKMIYIHNSEKCTASFDFYFLAAGAFESHRILLNSGFEQNNKFTFSDHLSQRIYKIKGKTKIGEDDFAFVVKGTSLRTNRIIGEINGCSYFINPIFNKEYEFFQNLKLLLFKGIFTPKLIISILKDIPNSVKFLWYMLIKRKIYVYKNEWYFYIDIENPRDENYIKLSSDKDKYGEAALNLKFVVSQQAKQIFEKAKTMLKEYLDEHHVIYEDCNSEIEIEKVEDTYHPFGMMSDFESIDDFYSRYKNLLIVNSGILPRAGGINSTAAMFPVVEEYINRYF